MSNLSAQFYFKKSDIVNLKSSEKFPFRFRTFPEFKQKAIEYMQHTPTRTFSREIAEKIIKTNQTIDLNKLVSISADTISNIFLEGKEEEDKIFFLNNSYLKDLLEKSDLCMYSNQHSQSKCRFFSCPPFQLDTSWQEENLDEQIEINYEDDEDGDLEEGEGEIDYEDEEDDEATHLPDFDQFF